MYVGKDAERDRSPHVVKPQSEDPDHSCRAVSIYGNDGAPSSILTIPKSIIPSRHGLSPYC